MSIINNNTHNYTMTNTCTVIITKGANKGKLCKDIHKWCKHKSITCSTCNRTFRYQHTYDSHTCEIKPKKGKIKVATSKPEPKLKINIRQRKDNTHVTHVDTGDQQSETQKLRQMVDQLKGEIDQMKNQPKTVEIHNLTVITDDIFGKIASELGKKGAVKFLLDTATRETECLDIVDRVYLNHADRDKYPIACRDDHHFRYLGPGHKIIDDVGGEKIVSRIANSVQNAYLRASNDLIRSHVNGDESDTFHMYDMRSVQDKINMLPTMDSKDRLREGLATKVRNPTHPFFRVDHQDRLDE